MKKILLLSIAASIIGTSCTDPGKEISQTLKEEKAKTVDTFHPYITFEYEVPKDSATQAQYREFITQTVQAASRQLTAGDYEHPQRLLLAAEETAKTAFTKHIPELVVLDDGWRVKLQPSELTPSQRVLYDSLLKKL